MTVTREDMIQTRITLIKQMDTYVRETIGDEEAIDFWLQFGLPDEACDEDYRYFAETEYEWIGLCDILKYIVENYSEQRAEMPSF